MSSALLLGAMLSVGGLTAVFDPNNPLSWLGAGGIVASIGAVLTMVHKEWFIPGSVLRERLADRDQRIADRDNQIAKLESALDQAMKNNEDLHKLIEGRTLDTLHDANNLLTLVMDGLKEEDLRRRLQKEAGS